MSVADTPDTASASESAAFLAATEIVDWGHPSILEKAANLAAGHDDPVLVARHCFEWVRDNIEHSSDFQRDPVTCRASEVLQHRTGYCYAKSHLLAALLRANGIPAGFCYQRLSMNDAGPPFCLHGLNAVYLPDYGWYRVDPRGNKPGVDAQFCPPMERLAFHPTGGEECEFREILAAPLPLVVDVLSRFHHWDDLLQNLPDWGSATLAADHGSKLQRI